MPATITSPDTSRLIDTIRRELDKLKTNKFVTVGIHEDTGIHEDSDMTNATLGALLNFGGGNIPSRPWLEPGVRAGIEDYIELIEDGAGEDPDRVLNQIGVVAVGHVKEYMTDLRTPPNAPATIAAKGGADNPLIDNGELRASVDYKITTDEPEEGIS